MQSIANQCTNAINWWQLIILINAPYTKKKTLIYPTQKGAQIDPLNYYDDYEWLLVLK